MRPRWAATMTAGTTSLSSKVEGHPAGPKAVHDVGLGEVNLAAEGGCDDHLDDRVERFVWGDFALCDQDAAATFDEELAQEEAFAFGEFQSELRDEDALVPRPARPTTIRSPWLMSPAASGSGSSGGSAGGSLTDRTARTCGLFGSRRHPSTCPSTVGM
jgi:hypothetical protein